MNEGSVGEGLHSSAAPSHSDKPCPLLSRPMKSLHNFKCCMLTGSISRQITGCLNCDSPGILNEFLFFCGVQHPAQTWTLASNEKKKKKKRGSAGPPGMVSPVYTVTLNQFSQSPAAGHCAALSVFTVLHQWTCMKIPTMKSSQMMSLH